jgi:Ca-activated chloride channel homolog
MMKRWRAAAPARSAIGMLMPRTGIVGMHLIVFLLGLVIVGLPQLGRSQPLPPTDANIATALDVSDSIMRHEAWLEFEGMARAIVAPVLLETIARGRHGRIGFAVFVWSSGVPQPVVPWTSFEALADAEAIAALIRAAHPPGPGVRERRALGEGLTDLSGAIRFGTELLLVAPFKSNRLILNVLGDGVDNIGAGPQAARAAALDAGITINGVVVGRDEEVAAYFRHRVAGGPNAFVIETGDPKDYADIMLTKFLYDLISLRPPPEQSSGRG